MAAPISSYDLLEPLSAPKKSSDEFDNMKEALKGFNFFAFIIHDPEKHSNFDREMGRIFDQLDYLTGDKLLFFTRLVLYQWDLRDFSMGIYGLRVVDEVANFDSKEVT